MNEVEILRVRCNEVEGVLALLEPLSPAHATVSVHLAALSAELAAHPASQALAWWRGLAEKADAARAARFAAPPVGGVAHCKVCGHGTNASGLECLSCSEG
jgi:hypothetical protein